MCVSIYWARDCNYLPSYEMSTKQKFHFKDVRRMYHMRQCWLMIQVRLIYFTGKRMFESVSGLWILFHSMDVRPLVSNASMITRFHSERSCAMMLSDCTSVRNYSLMSSIHFLLGLPLLFRPFMIPNTMFFTNRLSPILKICTEALKGHACVVFCLSCYNKITSCYNKKLSCYHKKLLFLL